MTAPGWYHAEGDPIGTVRHWDGTQWIGGPVQPPTATPVGAAGESPLPGPRRAALASAGRRVVARAIDFIIGSIIFGIFVGSGLGGSGPVGRDGFGFTIGSERLDTRFEFLVLGVFLLAWHTLWIHRAGGTPGKLMLNVRIADAATRSTPPDLRQSIVRSANYVIFLIIALSISANEAMAAVSLLIGLVSLILLFTESRRTVMDRIAGTIVIDR